MDGFKNIEIKNFRGIDHLKIDDFSRVNILLGQNSSGKSSVLEAISLLTGMGNPDSPLNMNRLRTRNLFIKLDIPGRTPPPLTIPAKKTKIYGYLEALLGTSKREKELIKEKERDYENAQHWNLDAEYLEELKLFLLNKLK